MKWIRKIHTVYGVVIFSILFLLLLVPFLIPIFFAKKHNWVGKLNRIWAKLLCIMVFLPYKVECKTSLSKNQQYIFCSNHFSYFDIVAMGLNPFNTIFVGKTSLNRIPLFGWMYSKLHITVNRKKLRSKYSSYLKSKNAIDEGKSLAIFPEGGIVCDIPPKLMSFKDGAFRLAIEKKIPIVPVSIKNTWKIMPPNKFLLHCGKVHLIIHEKIDTNQLKEEDVEALKQKTFQIIEGGL